MARQWPAPPHKNLLHIVGDIHQGTQSARLAKFTNDMVPVTGAVPAPVARLCVGDLTELGQAAQDTAILASFATFGQAPLYASVGNHDVWSDGRTATQWAAAYGLPGRNYTVDLGFALLVVIGPETMTTALTQTDLNFLDTSLAAATKDCIVMCHYPLYNTVLGGASYYQSIDATFFVLGPNGSDDTQVRSILNARSRAKVWLCGHTHSDIGVAGFIKTESLTSRSIISINSSAIPYTGNTSDWNDPIYTLWMNYYPGDRVDIRYRNHGAGAWGGPVGGRVTTLSVPS